MLDRRFVFSGTASGVAARLTRHHPFSGFDHRIPVQGASALPSFGGISESKVSNFSFSADKPRNMNILSAKSVWTRAVGQESEGGYQTDVESVVEGFSIFEKVQADLLHAHLTASQTLADKHLSVRARGNEIKGLRLGGHELRVVLDESVFSESPTKEALAQRFKADADLHGKFSWRFNAKQGAVAIPDHHGYYACTLVKELRWVSTAPAGVTIDGYSIVWPGFGVIYVAEILVGDESERLSMLRVKVDENPEKGAMEEAIATAEGSAGTSDGGGGGGEVGVSGSLMP